jgi:hypothetical protein
MSVLRLLAIPSHNRPSKAGVIDFSFSHEKQAI